MRPRNLIFMKREFLKKWMLGLQFYADSSRTNTMSFMERKTILALSGDIAMASVRDGKTSWSRALLTSSLKQANNNDDESNNTNKGLIRSILGNDFEGLNIAKASNSSSSSFGSHSCNTSSSVNNNNNNDNKRVRIKKILRRSCAMQRASRRKGDCSCRASSRKIAKRMVKKRTQVLKGLVPGGEAMVDESLLLEETMDYLVALQARVDVMRQLVKASERIAMTTISRVSEHGLQESN
ncbi:hypothetical protein Syun_025033 [Stephania yunnanensis]|uniref:IBH1-like N-terminal domain-containing protein n=1 Tax=Stephania yunnanensis TaxID=152371 RepID=A0AAP0EY03_9MAGN